jgi:hypothetical protein
LGTSWGHTASWRCSSWSSSQEGANKEWRRTASWTRRAARQQQALWRCWGPPSATVTGSQARPPLRSLDVSVDLVHHFPPDVFEALVEAIPLLVRPRKAVLLFFRGCGVDRQVLAELEARMDVDPRLSKYHATRELLTYLNDRGERALRERREVVKRVAGFDEFSSLPGQTTCGARCCGRGRPARQQERRVHAHGP